MKGCKNLVMLLLLLINISYLNVSQANWQETLIKAKGQTIYFNAWGGSQTINDYIAWAAKETKKRFDVTVKHVKIAETANVVNRIIAEKAVKKQKNGSVDLVWINGENFYTMKKNKLLMANWTDTLPNYAYLDFDNKPTLQSDFSIPVDNQEAPWGMAQLVFMYDTKKISSPPRSMQQLLALLKKHPQRFTYPKLPNFYGTTFIKQVLHETIADKNALQQPINAQAFAKHTMPLWDFLDQLHPLLWQQGKSFPDSINTMKKMLNDRQLFISFSFNPNDASNAIIQGELPDSVRTYIHRKGSIGNTHFVAIPFNSSSLEGAKVFANFLLSAEAQSKKADPKIWGDPTVLAVNKLPASGQKLFSRLDLGVASLTAQQLNPVLPEPHPDWVELIEKEWQQRYAN